MAFCLFRVVALHAPGITIERRGMAVKLISVTENDVAARKALLRHFGFKL